MDKSFWSDDNALVQQQDATRPAHDESPAAVAEALVAWQAEQPRDLAFPTDAGEAERQAWREEARRWLNAQLAWPAIDAPLDAEVHQRHECDGYIHEAVSFVGAAPMRVPATVLTPTAGEGPYPAVLVLHDMGGMRVFGREKMLAFDGEPAYLTEFRVKNYEGASILSDLVQRGYVVMTIDAQCFGDRSPAALRDPETFHQDRCQWDLKQARAFSLDISFNEEPTLVRQVMCVGRTWPGLIVADDRRSVDYLASRPDVDASRIGCAGLSFGAYRANYLAALDQRVAAAVSVCWSSTMDAVVGYNVAGAMGWFSLVPELFARMDLPDLQALAAPRPFMAISGWQDILMRPFGIARAHQALRRAWSAWDASEQLGSLVYDCPHEFNRLMQQQAWQWLDQWLKPR